MERIIKGITDITSSEGKLERFSQICKLIKPRQRFERVRLIALIKENIGLTNVGVISRHIRILQKLSIIEDIEGIFILSSEGKVLYQFIDEMRNVKKLSFKEKLLYFRLLFTSATDQLVALLEIINKDKSRNEIIIEYFKKKLVQELWWKSKKTIQKNLTKFEKNKDISQFFENKFRCMEMWLKSLNLLEKKHNYLKITPTGEAILIDAQKYKKVSNNKIYELSSKLLNKPAVNFDYKKHKNTFLDLLNEAYSRFVSESNRGDLRAMKSFISINLLIKNIVIEEKKFNQVLQKLWSEGKIRSVMADRKGKPAYIVI